MAGTAAATRSGAGMAPRLSREAPRGDRVRLLGGDSGAERGEGAAGRLLEHRVVLRQRGGARLLLRRQLSVMDVAVVHLRALSALGVFHLVADRVLVASRARTRVRH